MHGYFGHLLHIDLTSGRSSHRAIDESTLRGYLGGIGLGVSLLWDYAPAGIDPFSPANPLIFASAPLVGTGLTTTAKYAVVTKSPLTGFVADSLSSSYFALELKRLGIDALVITGSAPGPVYLAIQDEKVDVRAAVQLRGRSAAEAESLIRAELHSPTVRVAAIGLAGENRVRFATISNEGRHAGRGGIGAVMGSKNLKAIAICGSRDTPVADATEVEAIADSLRQRSLGSLTDKYRHIGTVANLAVFNHLNVLPTRNFQQAAFEGAGALSGETLTENNFSRRHGCASCTIRCERLFKSGIDGRRTAPRIRDALRARTALRHQRSRYRPGGRRTLRSLRARHDQHGRHDRLGHGDGEQGPSPRGAASRAAIRRRRRTARHDPGDRRARRRRGAPRRRVAACVRARGRRQFTLGDARQGPGAARIRSAQPEDDGARPCGQPARRVPQPLWSVPG